MIAVVSFDQMDICRTLTVSQDVMLILACAQRVYLLILCFHVFR